MDMRQKILRQLSELKEVKTLSLGGKPIDIKSLIGRESGLRSRKVWVRIPLEL